MPLDANIKVEQETRKRLKMLKVRDDLNTIDEAIVKLLDEHEDKT